MFRFSLAFRFFAATFFLFAVSAAATFAITLPADFEDGLVATVGAPTALAFTPDGRLLITTQPGRVRVYQNGALLAASALDLSAKICTNSERGVLGIAVDPNFSTNRFIYLYYTFNKNGNCDASTVNRVARFVLSDANAIDAASETVLIDNIHSPAGNHNGGDLHFGKDELLYVSVGDGGCDYAGDSGCAGANDAARDRHVLLGKILRITRDGAIPAGNPYQAANSSGRCNVTGSTTPGNWCQETFASGLRNPFRIAFDSNAANTRFFINDVGQNVWEEIDEGIAGADYGWNAREGHCANNSTTNCTSAPTVTVNNQVFTNPVFDYQHTSNCSTAGVRGNSITGGAFVPNGVWSAAYDNSYLVGEYVCGKIFKLTPNGTGGFAASEFATGLGGSSAVAMIFGPFQTTKALYYTTYAGGGQVRRIRYTGAANRNPVASLTATPTSGSAPLDVAFNAAASSDPDGDALAYSWNFGDGTTGTGVNPTHRYSANGTYTAILTVSDGRGGSAAANVRIDVGNTAPQPTIVAPTADKLFRVGETITLQGAATDAQDGTLANNRLTWEVILHHNSDHTHPFLSPTIGNNITITAPAPEDLDAATGSFLEIRLTATDAQGLSTRISQNLQPRKVNVAFQTNPTRLNLTVNNTNLTAPKTFVSWDGYALGVNAPNQNLGGRQYVFQSWSDGGAAAHTIITPATNATFTASFRATQTISGAIAYGITENNQTPLPVAGVNLNATGTSNSAAASDAAGNYQLSNLNTGGTYTVTPTKTGSVNGINSLDATRIQQHLVGLTTLTPNQLLAADTDGNGVVNSLDATRIQQYLVGANTPNIIGQWKFAPATRQYNAVGENLSGENFQAVLIGEVSGNWSPNAGFAAAATDETESIFNENERGGAAKSFETQSPERPAARIVESSEKSFAAFAANNFESDVFGSAVQISLPTNASATSGTTVTIPVSIGAIPAGTSIEAFDFSIFYDPTVLQFNGLAGGRAGTLSAGCSVLANSPAAGRVIVSGACAQGIRTGSGVLYNIGLTVVGAANRMSVLSFVNPASSVNTVLFNNGSPAASPTNGLLTVGGAATRNVSVSGRTTDNQGRGVRNVVVTLTDAAGNQRTTVTTSFGYYRFGAVPFGETVTLTARAKRFRFNQTAIVRTANGDLTDINFVAAGN